MELDGEAYGRELSGDKAARVLAVQEEMATLAEDSLGMC